MLLHSKVKQWSVGNRAMFPLQGGEWVAWEDVMGRAEEHKILWTKLKSSDRAVQKAHRAYGGDVSRLVDVVRESMAFETPVQLMDAFEDIMHDREVSEMSCMHSASGLYCIHVHWCMSTRVK
jgi:hypothetical protein